MFGGLSFLVTGNLAVSVSRQGGILIRVGPVAAQRLVETTDAEPAIMGDRQMRGWVRVGPDSLHTDEELQRWVDRGLAFARSLAPKAAKR